MRFGEAAVAEVASCRPQRTLFLRWRAYRESKSTTISLYRSAESGHPPKAVSHRVWLAGWLAGGRSSRRLRKRVFLVLIKKYKSFSYVLTPAVRLRSRLEGARDDR